MTEEQAKFDSIADEISRLTGYPRVQMGPDTRVYHDAGLAGLDYQEFLTWFSTKYNVVLSGLNVGKLSPPEGGGLGSLWPKRYIELSVADFVHLAGCSSWASSNLSVRRPK